MSGADRFFLDASVLLYTVDPRDRDKQSAARQWVSTLWASGAGSISWQVLHEFYANAVRRLGEPGDRTRAVVKVFASWQPVDTSLGLIERAWHWTDGAGLSYWDSLIVAAAERAGCRWLLSEEFECGRKFGAVSVISPFTSRPPDFGFRTGPAS